MNNLEYYCSSYRKMSGVAITSHKLIKDPCSVKDPKSHRPKNYRFNDHNRIVEQLHQIELKNLERKRRSEERAKHIQNRRRELERQRIEREKRWKQKYGHSFKGLSVVTAVGGKLVSSSGFGGRSIRKYHAFNKLGANNKISFSNPHKPNIPSKLIPHLWSRGLVKKRVGFSPNRGISRSNS